MSENTPESLTNRFKRLFASEWCFRLIIAFFVLEALWIALSGRYPMAFDENFHLGIIRLYAHHISPLWAANPPDSSALGPVAHDPSYLYQWLMSFPYRLSGNLIFLRIINIGLFAAGLALYRKLLFKTGAPRSIVHLAMALFVLIPVVPLLAAQVNYDNLFLPLTALILLAAADFSERLRFGRFKVQRLLLLAVLVTLACLVKYAFLPIALGVTIFVAVRLGRTYETPGQLRTAAGKGWARMSKSMRWLCAALLIVSVGLFMQRYAVNLAQYHKPVPACDEVLSAKQCKAYGPWYRDYQYAHDKLPDATANPLIFGADWFYGMWFRTFFAVDGPGSGYATRGPLILPAIGAIVLATGALLATAVSWRKMWRRYNAQALWLFMVVIASYTASLWVDEYHSFLQTSRPVAINGRYLLPIFPLLIVILALGVNVYLGSRQRLKLGLAALALICMLWGGGALTYVLRSDDAWYWPNTPLKGANHALQDTVGPLIPGYYDPHIFMGRHGT
jgi:hypothetical protein